MKINKKVIVSTLALAMGASLAGSIAGSVAWYQYSTRATASLYGTSAGSSRNLQISLDGSSWGWNLDNDAILTASAAKSASADGSLKPVAAIIDDVPTGFVSHTVRQYPNGQAAAGTEVLKFDIYLRSLKEGGAEVLEAVKVYLETFDIGFSGAGADLDEALRISISDGTHHYLLSKTAGTTTTHGELDLNGDNVNDRDIFEADDRTGLVNDSGTWKLLVSKVGVATVNDSTKELEAGTSGSGWFTDKACSSAVVGDIEEDVTYYQPGDEPTDYIDYVSDTAGGATNEYTTTAWTSVKTAFTDEYTPANAANNIGTTTTDAEHPLKLSFVIWLEGWAKIGEPASNIWNKSLVNKDFSIKMRFQAPAEK